MEPTILNPIPFRIDRDSLKKKLRIPEGNPHTEELEGLIEETHRIGRPRALYKLSFIDAWGDGHVVIDGIRFKSRILRINLDKIQRVFPFVATCGMELEEWSNRIADPLQRFWAETIKEMVVKEASNFVEGQILERYRPGKISRMSPGSLADWPIQEQRPLFRVLGDTKEMIGVYLTESLLMIPTKSVSGIRFPTEESFESCQLCPREICPNRRAPYDPTLYDTKYRNIPA